jgi:CheY-like chemotaxis protein
VATPQSNIKEDRFLVCQTENGLLMSSPELPAVDKPKVLLVEDEALVAMIAADTLEELGFDVVQVGTTRAALEQAGTDCARFALAVVDMGLPDRPGQQLVAELRKICPSLPIIVASGYGESEVRRRFEAEQRFAFLNKPFEQATLRAAIDSLGLAPLG